MDKNLSKSQRLIYDFIKKTIRENGFPPSVREIGIAVGLSSTSTVHSHLTSLEKKGYIHRISSKKRCIGILDQNFYNKDREMINIPIIRNLSSEKATLDDEKDDENTEDTFPLPVEYFRAENRYFMLRINGDSMNGIGINDKDMVIVKEQTFAENGDIVVAIVGDYATVKTFYKEKDYYRLQPENDNFDPIIMEEVEILGVVAGLFRTY